MRAAAPAPCGVRSEPPAPSCGATTCEVRRPGPVDKGTADRACPLIHRPDDGGPAGAGNAKICGNVTPSVTRSFEATRGRGRPGLALASVDRKARLARH